MSADQDKERRENSRFIKKHSMFSISECDSNQEGDEGYLSDPGHLNNSKELKKLYKVAPNLQKDLDMPLREKIKPHGFQELNRIISDDGYVDWENLGD